MDFGGDIGIWQRRLAECNEGLERRKHLKRRQFPAVLSPHQFRLLENPGDTTAPRV